MMTSNTDAEKGENEMLRTNSKIVRERVRAYVLENSEDIRESMESEEVNIDDILKYVWSVFMSEYRRGNFQEEFARFGSGLPFNIFDYYYNVSAIDLVGDLLDETEEERSRYSESDAERLMSYLIFRECEKSAR